MSSRDDIDRMVLIKDVNGLIGCLNSGSSSKRNYAVQGLIRLRDQAFEAVVKATQSSDKVLRRKCCDVLGSSDNPKALPVLHKLLVDPDRHVRRRAANALVNVGTEDSVIPLIDALKDSELKVQLRSAEALGNIGDIRSVNPLNDLASQLSSSDKEKVISAMNKINWEPGMDENGAKYWINIQKWDKCVEIGALAVNPLLNELNNSNGDIRNSAVGALVEIGEPAYKQVVLASNGPDEVVRRKCSDVLGLMVNPDAIPHLIRLLKDSDDYVRRRAANALININNNTAVDALCVALKDGDSTVRSRSATALGVIGDERAIDNLVTALNDYDNEVRLKSTESLNKMGWNPPNNLSESSIGSEQAENTDENISNSNPTINVSFYESMPGRISLDNNSDYIKGILELKDNEIVVHKKSFWRGVDRGTKHIRYDKITSIDYDAGKFLAAPSIQIYLSSVEYSFQSYDERLKSFYNKIREKMELSEKQLETQTIAISPLDELKKLAELKELGIVSEEEFQLKKKQLLGL